MRLGSNLNGRHDPTTLLGDWARIVCRPGLEAQLLELQRAGVEPVLVLARESFSDAAVATGNYFPEVFAYADAYPSVERWQPFNEPDGTSSDSSWTMTPRQLVDGWTHCAAALVGRKLILPGMKSGSVGGPAYLRSVLPDLDLTSVEAGAFHGYGAVPAGWQHPHDPAWGFVPLDDLIEAFLDVLTPLGLGLWCTEYGTEDERIKPEYLVAMTRGLQAHGGVQRAAFFCHHHYPYVTEDGRHVNWGVLEADGSPTPAYIALEEAFTMPTVEQRLALLERQQSIQTEALRYLIEGKWTGEMPHAAAYIASLYGTPPVDFHPVEFPKAAAP